jgi:hypothetical protein
MTESTYAAMRAYIDVAVELQVEKLRGEIRAAVPTTRAAEAGPALPGKDGKNGDNGKDGVGIAAVSIRGADLVVSLTNGTEQNVGRVVGEKGEHGLASTVPGPKGDPSTVPGPKGERGADGIATASELDARIEARFSELQVRTFADVYQGVFEPDKAYTRGLLATWGGSLWLSLTETRSKPGENGDWKLIVKKGSDGRK